MTTLTTTHFKTNYLIRLNWCLEQSIPRLSRKLVNKPSCQRTRQRFAEEMAQLRSLSAQSELVRAYKILGAEVDIEVLNTLSQVERLQAIAQKTLNALQAAEEITKKSLMITNVAQADLTAEEKSRLQIIMVDDEAYITHANGQALSADGFKITAFNSSREVMEYLSTLNKEPDTLIILITDNDMPEMDGIELVRKLREMKCPVDLAIMNSANDPSSNLKLAREVKELGLIYNLKPLPLLGVVNAAARRLLDGKPFFMTPEPMLKPSLDYNHPAVIAMGRIVHKFRNFLVVLTCTDMLIDAKTADNEIVEDIIGFLENILSFYAGLNATALQRETLSGTDIEQSPLPNSLIEQGSKEDPKIPYYWSQLNYYRLKAIG